jgi:hypothetical protein
MLVVILILLDRLVKCPQKRTSEVGGGVHHGRRSARDGIPSTVFNQEGFNGVSRSPSVAEKQQGRNM